MQLHFSTISLYLFYYKLLLRLLNHKCSIILLKKQNIMDNNYSNTIKEMLNNGEISNDQKIDKGNSINEISIQQHYKNVSIIKICLLIITGTFILGLVFSILIILFKQLSVIL
jgi:hypothetical protein